MKTLNTVELDYLIEATSFLKGYEFQSVQGSKDLVILKFWDKGPAWLVFNLSKNKPFFLAFKNKADFKDFVFKKADKKPLNIFLETHFKGYGLSHIQTLAKYGRVLRFHFREDENLYIEFRCYPGGLNFSAVKIETKGNKGRTEVKAVHWKKPVALEEVDSGYEPELVRSPAVIFEEALAFLNKKKKGFPQESQVGVDKTVNSKPMNAVLKIKEGLQFLRTDGYKRFAEILESNEDLPKDLKPHYRKKLSKRENIEWAYEQQKLKDLKLERLEKRLQEVESQGLKKTNEETKSQGKTVVKATRFMELSKDVRAFCGKTARENIDLLRKAKSWHLWMHLKDYPSGHLILDIPKNYTVSEGELKQAALFLFKVAAPKKLHMAHLVKFEVIYTESKFVKPIKGAKHGLVQPTRTKTRLYEWSKKDQIMY